MSPGRCTPHATRDAKGGLTGGRREAQRGRMDPLAPSPSPPAHHARRRAIAVAALGLAALVVIATALALPADLRAGIVQKVTDAAGKVRALGPGWFFAAFALLPATGFPVSVFALAAGPLFAPVLGLPLVLLLSTVCMAISLSLSYALARHVLRPQAARWLGYLGYGIPELPAEKVRLIIFLTRVTPGPPYVLQSSLLGLAGAPFVPYFWISLAVSGTNVLLLIIFGAAVIRGGAIAAAAALVALGLAALLVRTLKRRAMKKAAP